MKTYSVPFLIGCLLILNRCSDSKKSSEAVNDLNFDVNLSLLGEEFIDSLAGIRLKVPVGWENLSNSKVENLKLKFSEYLKDTSVRAVYIDTLNQASLIISEKGQWSDFDVKSRYTNPDSVFNQENQWEPIMKSDFMLNGLGVYQFLLQSKDLINFKLIGKENEKKFQIDYIIGRATYLKQVKKVESSIGTLRSF